MLADLQSKLRSVGLCAAECPHGGLCMLPAHDGRHDTLHCRWGPGHGTTIRAGSGTGSSNTVTGGGGGGGASQPIGRSSGSSNCGTVGGGGRGQAGPLGYR